MPVFCFIQKNIINDRRFVFSFVITLAIASAAVELIFASKFPVWRRVARQNKAVNLSISIALSFLLGIMFGAAGLIAMSAAIISTVLVIPGYALLEWAYDSPEAQAKGGNLIKYYSDKAKVVSKDTINLVYKILRILTFPIWAFRSILDKYRVYANKARTFKSKHFARTNP